MEKIKNRGWQVVTAGLGINLALGILYTWSIFKLEIKESIQAGDGRFNWDIASLNDPFAVCCLMFTLGMLAAGRLQDKVNPRLTAIIWRPSDRCRSSGHFPEHHSGQLDPRFRGAHRPGSRFWLRFRHAAGHQVVSGIKNRHDRRYRCGRIRTGLGLYCASGQFSDRPLRHQQCDDDLRRCLYGRGLWSGPAAGQPARRIQAR